MPSWDDFRIEFDADGTLRIRGRQGWREAICPVCGEPIRWVLDMASFVNQPDASFALAHARCAWTPEAFEEQARLASGPGTADPDFGVSGREGPPT